MKDWKKKWNWAAFSLNVIWGVVHGTWLPVLCCIPVFGTIWMFVCGLYGTRWIAKDGRYLNEEDFLEKEHGWTIAGIIASILIGLIFIDNIAALINFMSMESMFPDTGASWTVDN